MAPYKILRQGYIEKEPPLSKRGLRKKLYRYWFVLVEDRKQVAMVYFKNEDQYLARQRNEGFIRVDEAEAISVVGEFMGRKHAFTIKTPKTEFTLAPESRYDLHEWIYALHNAIEVFRRRQERQRQRQQGDSPRSRPRANTADSSQLSSQGGRTPPVTPTRRAPPPPEGRRRPHRPAPTPPTSRQSSLQEPPPTVVENMETPPPSYADSEPSGGEVELELDVSEELNQSGPPYNSSAPLGEEDSNLLQQTSSSMPDLMADSDTPTTSPENVNNEQGHPQASPLESIKTSPGGPYRHTRHHSLTITEIKAAKRKRGSRRQGSIKLRSRSPPELPPPPPPGEEVPNGNGLMEALSDIEQQIDQMSDEFSPRATPTYIRTPSPVLEQSGEHEAPPSPIQEVPHQLQEVPHQLQEVPHEPVEVAPPGPEEEFVVEEWLCDDTQVGVVRDAVLASPEVAEMVSHESSPKSHDSHKKKVMFREDVEDIPNSYEPMADAGDQSDDSDEAMQFSVAELKKRLFGEREVESARYKREGPLSPKNAHPVGAAFTDDYHYTREMSPNVNNNNSELATPPDNTGEGLYDKPWESRALVLTHEAPPIASEAPPTTSEAIPIASEAIPSSRELDIDIGQEEIGSLLSSISSTLQETSKYGSDSFLNSPEVKPQVGVRISSKGEIEKIRAEHRVRGGKSPKKQGASPTHFSGPPRNASSLNALSDGKSKTEVSYDSSTNSHIFRSLV